ncbi:MAG TPA: hypothetical protein VM580_32250 [Labilithrix sp.]|nr:hypothetical protein [Labilithrix sp.]
MSRNERFEYLLLETLRAPREYQSAVIALARRGQHLRERGGDAYVDGLVHFALSRIPPETDGTVPLSRLRDVLCDQNFDKVVLQALIRLRDGKLVELVAALDDASGSGGSAPQFHRVKVLVQP